MKTILCSLFIAIAASSSCAAQSVITITLSAVGTVPCTFTASALTQGIVTTPAAVGGAPGKAALAPIKLTKVAGPCSSVLLADMFRNDVSATIALTARLAGVFKPTLTLTLTNVSVTSVNTIDDIADGSDGIPESITLRYVTIKVANQVDNTTVTCSAVSQSCS